MIERRDPVGSGRRLKIYLDNCCYNRPFDDQTNFKIYLEAKAKLNIQQQIRADKLDLATSYILVMENNANLFASKRNDIQHFIDRFTHTFVSEMRKAEVIELAQEIMRTGVKLMDACHVACAIIAGCDYFITTDKRLLKYQSDRIRVVNPIAFIMEREDEA